MKTLLVYATNSGSTLEVANYIASEFSQIKNGIEVLDARKITPETFYDYDLIILGAPTWDDGSLVEYFSRALEKFADKKFPDKNFAVFGLGHSTFPRFCGAADQLEDFVKQVDGKFAAPVLKIDNYYFNQQEEAPKISEWVKKMIAV